jgi:HEAT repeats
MLRTQRQGGTRPEKGSNKMIPSRTVRKIGVSVLVSAALVFLLVGALGVALWAFVWNAISRIEIDPAAVTTAVKTAVVTILKDGEPEQKLEMIRTLRDMGTDAREFVPALTAAHGDGDARVRAAAAEALRKIDPAAAEKAAEK